MTYLLLLLFDDRLDCLELCVLFGKASVMLEQEFDGAFNVLCSFLSEEA